MEVGKLTVKLRNDSGKGISRRLRSQGLVPGICYGAGVDAPLSVVIDPKALKASLDPVKRQNTVIDVTVEEDGKSARTIKAMLWEYQVHPIKQTVTHVDLKAIDPEQPVEAEVPIELVGKHKGAIDGGLLSFPRRWVTIKAKPDHIPDKLELDITPLDIGDVFHISDVPLPEGVEWVSSEKLTIVACVAPKADRNAEAAAPAEGEAAAAPAEDKKKEG